MLGGAPEDIEATAQSYTEFMIFPILSPIFIIDKISRNIIGNI